MKTKRWHLVVTGCSILATALSAQHEPSPPDSFAFEGVVRGTPARQLVLPAPDQPRHILGLVETNGAFEASQGSGFLAGASVATVETWDFVAGRGTDRGFIVFGVGGDRLVGRYVGKVSPAEGGRSELTGEIVFESGTGTFAGVQGHASYVGWADSKSFEMKITGRCERTAGDTSGI